MKLKVKTEKTVKDLQTLLNATTGREIKLALEGYTIVPIKKAMEFYGGRTLRADEITQDMRWDIYEANAN